MSGAWGHEYIDSAARSYPDLSGPDRAEVDGISRRLVEEVRVEFPDGWVYGTPLASDLRRHTALRWIVSWQIDFQRWRVFVVQISGPSY